MPVQVLAELSAELPELAHAEFAAVVASLGGHVGDRDLSVAIASLPQESDIDTLGQRLALAHTLSSHWWTAAATPRAIVPPFGRLDMQRRSFAIRGRRIEGAHHELPLSDTIRAAGALLAVSGKVDLKQPEVEIRMVVADMVHVGAHRHDIDRSAFEARAPKHREHFSPIAIHPKFARALANLAGAAPGVRVVDPFVGTGGMLIEAGLLGADVLGGDLDERMVAGTREELERQGIDAARVTCEVRDVGELPEWVGRGANGVDAVLSDPPYGRASTTNREAMDELYDRFFDATREALRPGGRLACIFPSEALRSRAEDFGLRRTFACDQKVHRSMTRHWGVFVRA